MKLIFFPLFALLSVISISIFAQTNCTVHENSYQKISVSFTFGELKSEDIITVNGNFSRIYMEGSGNSRNIGNPELPASVKMFEIPFCEEVVLNVCENDFVIYDAQTLGINYPVYPAQPPRSKSYESFVAFAQNQNTYQTDAFYGSPTVQFEKVGFMRNVNVGQLLVCPVQYNPVTHEVKSYQTLTVELIFKQTDVVKTQTLKELHESPLFFSSHLVNAEENSHELRNSTAEFTNTPIKYLIVAHSMFRGAMDKFVVWKKRKGFIVEAAYTDEENVGATTSSIAGFIKSHYTNATPENPAPTYVLLVGDVQQIPAFAGKTGKHPTDLYYFTWEGGNIPCCYYGRFSAQNLQQLLPQIEKTLQYEQYAMPNANYLNKISLIAGYDNEYASIHGNGFLNYVTQNYANTAYGYTTVNAHFHPCHLDAERIRTEIFDGVGMANYTAHCSSMGWSNPEFSTYHIPRMKNENKWGLMIGNCCYSNEFDVNECFGEALLRADGKGAVGYIGASNETFWDEDFYWGTGFKSIISDFPAYYSNNLGAYDRLFHTHLEEKNKWMTTFGAIYVAGNEAVQSSTSDLKHYYWEIYHLMGDPSVMAYLTKPAQMLVGIHDEISPGAKSLSAKVAPYSYCAFTNKNGELLSAGFADSNGDITLHFEPTDSLAEYEFAAWTQNYVQYFKTIKCNISKKNYLEIYPNPVHNTLMIISKKLIFAYEFFDLTGRVVASKKNINEQIIKIDVSALANGMYFIKVIDSEQKSTVQKVIIQN